MLVKIDSYTPPQVYWIRIFREGTCDFADQASLGRTEIQAYLVSLCFTLVCFTYVVFFTHWRENHPPAERSHRALLWDLLYFGGLQLRHDCIIVYMQVTGKECIGKEGSGCSRELGNYSMFPPNTKMSLTFQWWWKNMTELCLQELQNPKKCKDTVHFFF